MLTGIIGFIIGTIIGSCFGVVLMALVSISRDDRADQEDEK